jgi:hypothetical protein
MPGTDIEPRLLPQLPVVPARGRVAESVPGRMARAARDNPHVSVPFAVPAGLWLAAEAASAAGLAGPVAAASVTGTAAMWWLIAPRRWPDPPAEDGDEPLRWHQSSLWWARASCAAGCGWVSLAAYLGPAGPDGGVLAGLLAVIATVWGIRWWLRSRPPRKPRRARKMEAAELAHWNAVWRHYAGHWGVPGSYVAAVTHGDSQVILRVQLVPGRQVPRMLQQNAHLIESGLQGYADAGMVRVAGVAGDASLADVFIKQADPLADFIEWEEELAPSSVHDLFPEGWMESGRWRMAVQRVSSFIGGMTRSGKSNGQLVRIACLSRCPDARTVVIDLKGGRSGRPVLRASAAEYVITTLGEARDYLLMLATEVRYRAMLAGTGRGEQLLANDTTHPAIMTLIDECWGLTSQRGGDASCRYNLAIVASQGSGVECFVDAAAQIGTLEESVGERQVRSNMDRRVCYRTAEAQEGRYVLGEDPRLDTSKLAPVGTFLAKFGPDAPQEKIRAINMPEDLFAEVAWSRLDDAPLALFCGSQPCPVEGYRTWGDWWALRWGRLPAEYHDDSPQHEAHVASLPPQWQPLDDAEDDTATPPAPVAAGRPPSGPPPAGAPDTVKRAAFCAAVQAAGDGIAFGALQAASGLGKTTTARYLKLLTEQGAVTQTARGWYVPVPGADIARVLTAILAGADDLLRAFAAGTDPATRRLHVV